MLTQYQIDLFHELVDLWRKEFQLGDWNITQESSVYDEDDEALAKFSSIREQRSAHISLNRAATETTKYVAFAAFHEVAHVYLLSLVMCAWDKIPPTLIAEYDHESEIEQHAAINRLKCMVWVRWWDENKAKILADERVATAAVAAENEAEE